MIDTGPKPTSSAPQDGFQNTKVEETETTPPIPSTNVSQAATPQPSHATPSASLSSSFNALHISAQSSPLHVQSATFEGNIHLEFHDQSVFQKQSSDDISLLQKLEDIPIVPPDGSYLDNSRREMVEEILSLTNSPTPSPLIWLHGAAGIGKSTLASHLTTHFKKERRLAAYITFKRRTNGTSSLKSVTEAIARQIIHHFPASRSAVIEAIKSLIPPSDHHSLFQSFILKPLALVNTTRATTPVIVIDGLDEYADATKLIEALSEAIIAPCSASFIVTSRLEPDIDDALQELRSHQVPIGTVNAEVMNRFFVSRFSSVRPKLWTVNGDPAERVPALVTAADGLFVWAATACSFITNRNASGSASSRLTAVLQAGTLNSTPKELYAVTLHHLFPEPEADPDNILACQFPLVMAILMVIQEPMTPEEVEELLQYEYPIPQLAELLQSVQTKSSTNGYITPITSLLHTSFLDYLREGCEIRFRVTPEIIKQAHTLIARKSIATLNEHFAKSPLPITIPRPVRYASDNWAGHACQFDLKCWREPLDRGISEELNLWASSAFSSYIHLRYRKAEVSCEESSWPDAISGLQHYAHRINETSKRRILSPATLGEAAYFQTIVTKLRDWGSGELTLLGNLYEVIYRREGSSYVSQEEFCIHERALALRPHPDSDRATSLNNLGTCLQARYQEDGNRSDLDYAIVLHEEALSLRPHPHPDRFKSLNNLAICLESRFEEDRDDADFERAVVLQEEALSLCPEFHPNHSCMLYNLAQQLKYRYNRDGDNSDLDRAIELHEQALPIHPHRSQSIFNLANCLRARFDREENLSDLDRAIALQEEVLGLLPYPDTDRPQCLKSLAEYLRIRLDRRGDAVDRERAITLLEEAIHQIPNQGSMYNRCINLLKQFKRLREGQDR